MSGSEAPTSFWWVNQTKTFKLEKSLGLLWAPRVDDLGHAHSHWSSMERLAAGDVVFHYSRQAIQAVSRVTLAAREAQRPYDLERWDALGLEVELEFQELGIPLPLTEIPVAVRRTQRHKNSPFRSDDKVNVGYLFDLTPEAGVELLRLTGALLPDSETTSEAESPNGTQRPFVFVEQTDGTILRKFRRERRKLRDSLLGDTPTATCDLCGRSFPTQFLVSAHIKPRHKCSEAERRDSNVVFAACAFGCDAVFEHGLVVVGSDGRIREGRKPTYGSPHLTEALDQLVGGKVARFSEANARYFAWHERHNS